MRFENLQIARFVGSFLVVVSHTLLTVETTGNVGIASALDGIGTLGVALFFVISGFLMTELSRREQHPILFLRDRFRRIIPTYWVLTAAWAAVVWAMHEEFDLGHFLASLAFVSQPVLKSIPTLYLGWTLEYEMAFYFVIAATMFVKAIRIRGFLAAFVVLIAVFFHYLGPTAIYFVLGVGVSYFLRSGLSIRIKKSKVLSHPAFWVTLSVAAVTQRDDPNFGWLAHATFSIFLVTGMLIWKEPSRSKFMLELGDASYSTYLTHPFTLVLGLTAIHHLPVQLSQGRIFAVLIFIVICQFLGVMFWRKVDRPIQAKLKSLTSKKSATIV